MLKKSPPAAFSHRSATQRTTRERARLGGLGAGRVKKWLRLASRHWALTGSRPSANMTLIILRVADLAVALLDSLFEHPEVIWR
jgi:hypothetical protein